MKKINLNKDNIVTFTIALLGSILVIIGIFLNEEYYNTLFIAAGIILILSVIGDYVIGYISNKING